MNAKWPCFLTLCFLSSSAFLEARTWTEAGTGRTFEGDFRKLHGTEVEIIMRPSGSLVKLPLARFSAEDQSFIAEQQATPAPSPAPAAPPKVTHKKGEKLEAGDIIDISFRSLNAGKVELASMAGKVVLLDFWATWCGPCIAELPSVKAAYEKYHAKGFEIIGISLDSDKSALENFIKKNDMPWPQHFDGKGWGNELGTYYGVRSIPAVYLLKDHEVIATSVRGSALEAKLKELLD